MSSTPPDLGFGISERLLKATEALLFAADNPIDAVRIAEIIAEVTGEAEIDAERVEAVIERLREMYSTNGRAFEIVAWAGGYRLVTREEVAPFVKAMVRDEQRFSSSRPSAVRRTCRWSHTSSPLLVPRLTSYAA